MFIRLLTSLVNAWNHTKCVFVSNQKCEVQHTFININNEFNLECRYDPFTVK